MAAVRPKKSFNETIFLSFPSSTTTPWVMYLFSSHYKSQGLFGSLSTWLVEHLGMRLVVADFWTNVLLFREDCHTPCHNCSFPFVNVLFVYLVQVHSTLQDYRFSCLISALQQSSPLRQLNVVWKTILALPFFDSSLS